MRKFFILLVLATGLCFSCNKNGQSEAGESIILTSQSHELTFEANGGEETISFYSTGKWALRNASQWLVVSPLSGSSGNSIINVFCEANPYLEARNCVLDLSCGKEIVQVTVAQSAMEGVSFADNRFYSYLLSIFDDNHDGTLSVEELQKVKSISCPNSSIQSLAGIRYCNNLERLDVSGNPLEEIAELSYLAELQELNVSSTNIEVLDLSGNCKLNSLVCKDDVGLIIKNYQGFSGIVFSDSKVLSLEESSIVDWHEAKTWVESLKINFILPSQDDLKNVFAKKTDLNNALKAAGYKGLCQDDVRYYWSGETFSSFAFNPDMINGVFGGSRYSYLTDKVAYARGVRYIPQDIPQGILVESIELHNVKSQLYVGESVAIDATIRPDNATNKTLRWSSSDESIATVTQNGKVTAIACGFAEIMAEAVDGSGCCVCFSVNVSSTSGSIPEGFVDMGLSVYWAAYDVEMYGYNLTRWGEGGAYTDSRGPFSWQYYKWCNGSEFSLTKYNTKAICGNVDMKTTLELSDDAANHCYFVGDFSMECRMPTKDEFKELIDNCTWGYGWDETEDVYVIKATSKKTNKSIYFHQASQYWSASLNKEDPRYAWALFVGSSPSVDISDALRYHGLRIHAVKDK